MEKMIGRGVQLNASTYSILLALVLVACGEAKKDEPAEPVVDPTRGREVLEAIKAGEDLKVIQMIDRDANLLFAKDNLDQRPLHVAVRYKRAELVTFFIRKGAYVNHLDVSGNSPLMWAIEYERPDFVEALLRAGANPDRQDDSQDWGPLHMACFYSQADAVKMLLDRGAKVNEGDNKGRSPLLWALTPMSRDRRLEVLPLLLDRGAEVDITTKEGLTPIQIIEGRGGETAPKLVQILRKHGAE
ncbi:MAG TPA: ankyrin repeat domain-containing protein [Bacteroidota bacterium]